MRAIVMLAVLGALLVGATSAHAQSPPPNLPWPALLPPLEAPTTVQPGAVPGCARPEMACIERMLARMRAVRRRLGCDHRAVFATTYLLLSEEIHSTLVRQPRFFRHREWLTTLAVVFSNLYFKTIDYSLAGRPVPEAWAISFETAASSDANAAHDLLLGINAHVQRDMPYAMAAVGLRTRDGQTRKGDHDAQNQVLANGYERIVREIERSYDPIISVSNSEATPVDDMSGLEMVKGWREGVWRNAERLLGAKTAAERASIDNQIETNAATWARAIASGKVQPGYRATRDAYCRRNLRLPAETARAKGRLRLAVAPRRARVGGVRRMRFRVAYHGPTGRIPVRSALVRVGGRRLRTNRRGRVVAKVRFRRAGNRRVTARRKGLGRARAFVNVSPPGRAQQR